VIEDLSVYMDTIYSLRGQDFDFVCVPHSVSLLEDESLMDSDKINK